MEMVKVSPKVFRTFGVLTRILDKKFPTMTNSDGSKLAVDPEYSQFESSYCVVEHSPESDYYINLDYLKFLGYRLMDDGSIVPVSGVEGVKTIEVD